MRRLMLLRHAKSDRPAGIGDHERPLARRGRGDSAAIGRYMAASGLRPDLVVVSTARRAEETWELARPAFAQVVAQRHERRIYEASAPSILEVIRETDPRVTTLLLVGHNPGFHDLALGLVGGGRREDLARLRQKYPTAGLVVLDFDQKDWRDLQEGEGRLERFVIAGAVGKAAKDG